MIAPRIFGPIPQTAPAARAPYASLVVAMGP